MVRYHYIIASFHYNKIYYNACLTQYKNLGFGCYGVRRTCGINNFFCIATRFLYFYSNSSHERFNCPSPSPSVKMTLVFKGVVHSNMTWLVLINVAYTNNKYVRKIVLKPLKSRSSELDLVKWIVKVYLLRAMGTIVAIAVMATTRFNTHTRTHVHTYVYTYIYTNAAFAFSRTHVVSVQLRYSTEVSFCLLFN